MILSGANRKSLSATKSQADPWQSIDTLLAGRTMIDFSQKSEVIGSSPMDVKNPSASLNISSAVKFCSLNALVTLIGGTFG